MTLACAECRGADVRHDELRLVISGPIRLVVWVLILSIGFSDMSFI